MVSFWSRSGSGFRLATNTQRVKCCAGKYLCDGDGDGDGDDGDDDGDGDGGGGDNGDDGGDDDDGDDDGDDDDDDDDIWRSFTHSLIHRTIIDGDRERSETYGTIVPTSPAGNHERQTMHD